MRLGLRCHRKPRNDGQRDLIRRHADGSAGDVDYGALGARYAEFRKPDPRIAAQIHAALGAARTVLNVGAGAGSYEPLDRLVTAVEPSASMRAQRPTRLPPAIDAVAERLPFPDGAFDASMALFTVHQWPDLAAGLREMRRVTRGAIAIMTADPDLLARFWLAEYAPEMTQLEAQRCPQLHTLTNLLGRGARVEPIAIPLDCTDGFNEAYYGRPEMFLDAGARRACSSWSLVAPDVATASVERLSRDLADGAWDARHGALRSQPTYHGALRLVIS
jgi:SAM-dependent methyltransferase